MKVGLAQINTIVGDLPGNSKRILNAYHKLVADGAELVVFPELVITGYPPRDLLFKSRFVPDNLAALQNIAAICGDIPALIGYVAENPGKQGRRFLNSAAWCQNGKIVRSFQKCLLPTYDVFDEDRYFEAGTKAEYIQYKGMRIGVTICEDIWSGATVETSRHYTCDPLKDLLSAKVDLTVNLSASPWHYGKDSTRQNVVHQAADRTNSPLVYVNAIGGNDELIFDGHSMVMLPNGQLLAGLAPFCEDLRVVDILNTSTRNIHPQFSREAMADIHDALILGLRDYAQKSGFTKALIGLSGGIDSALTAYLAKAAFGPENVIGISLPSAISSQHSKDDARLLAENLSIHYNTVEIADIVDAAQRSLAPIFEGLSADVTEENIQARTRGLLLMAISNKLGALLLTTGNKSEISVGYCTLYGDMAGGLAVISDLPKTKVFDLCRWINRNAEIIPHNTISKPPSAELRPDQKDEDSLPPYPILDGILRMYVELGCSSQEIISAGYEAPVVKDVVRKVDLNEYKRKQAAPGLKITPLAFGVGRRIPIVQKYIG